MTLSTCALVFRHRRMIQMVAGLKGKDLRTLIERLTPSEQLTLPGFAKE